ncbi:hypothetical protein [Streptomyces sp. NBC_00557]|uniref:hypothetical protein n=1 Tax=Streptomyces sp. NBC_00557 TaxID=2975776 RepID=UPI002E800844|nr:hypothetical protein [Streptomyces sp. NBC_00557]WUC39357.1 hypothetical protein OG956_36660 [Streptomyces sp. NBC_00557]
MRGGPERRRLIVRRVKPSSRQLKGLTGFEERTGWRYSMTARNIPAPAGHRRLLPKPVLDALRRDHAEVEARIRTSKSMGLRNLPSQSWHIDAAWMLAADLACDLETWLGLLALHDSEDLADAEQDAKRFRLKRLPARLAATLAVATCASSPPGPGHRRSPPAEVGSAACQLPPSTRPPPRRGP